MKLKSILSISLLLAVNTLSSQAFAETSVWKVSKGDNAFYLGGTIHLLSKDDHPLPKEFDDAYKKADRLIFEVDLKEADTPEAQQSITKKMSYSDGSTLPEALTEETYKKLSDHFTARGLPVAAFSGFKPWGVSIVMTVLEYQNLGMQPDYGVDQHYYEKAIEDKKPVSGLETFEEQLAFLATMGDIEPNTLMEYTLLELTTLPTFIKSMKANWRAGDIEAFTKDSATVEMREKFPDLYNAIVVKRNNNWMPHLLKLNDDAATEFVLVGTMHLNDKEGLLQQLEKAGHTVEQVDGI
ncbi:TraB/GumN family protein [Leucothrix sargassi]|nr:TraB/GumN family protein [Leucothrix sargassi]